MFIVIINDNNNVIMISFVEPTQSQGLLQGFFLVTVFARWERWRSVILS